MTNKTLGNTDQNPTTSNVKDVVFFNQDLFKLLSKASSQAEGWMKSTKAMQVPGGCVVQVTTQQGLWNHEKQRFVQYSLAEALTFVPGVIIHEQFDNNNEVIGRYLGLPE